MFLAIPRPCQNLTLDIIKGFFNVLLFCGNKLLIYILLMYDTVTIMRVT